MSHQVHFEVMYFVYRNATLIFSRTQTKIEEVQCDRRPVLRQENDEGTHANEKPLAKLRRVITYVVLS